MPQQATQHQSFTVGSYPGMSTMPNLLLPHASMQAMQGAPAPAYGAAEDVVVLPKVCVRRTHSSSGAASSGSQQPHVAQPQMMDLDPTAAMLQAQGYVRPLQHGVLLSSLIANQNAAAAGAQSTQDSSAAAARLQQQQQPMPQMDMTAALQATLFPNQVYTTAAPMQQQQALSQQQAMAHAIAFVSLLNSGGSGGQVALPPTGLPSMGVQGALPSCTGNSTVALTKRVAKGPGRKSSESLPGVEQPVHHATAASRPPVSDILLCS